MPTRPNAESKLISALVNAGDVKAAQQFGIRAEMFATHRQEYEWLVGFPDAYDGTQPSPISLTTRFADFPYTDGYADVQFICTEVQEKYEHREMVTVMREAGDHIRNGDLREAYEAFRRVKEPKDSLILKPKNVLWDESFLDVYTKDVDRIEMPWKTPQKETGGPAAGDFWLFAARPGQGKSWTLASLARKALMDGKKVIMYSLEMPTIQVLARIHTMLAQDLGFRVSHSDLHGRAYDPISYRKLLKSIRENVPGELFVVDSTKGQVTTSTITSTVEGHDLALLDYIGLMSTSTGARAVEDWRTMANISNVLKEIAIANEIPIVAAAQINREGETGGWKPPKLKNLAQSDALGQDADVVITMKKRSKNVAVYSIEKNRHGESDVLFHTRFQPNDGKFDEISFEFARDLVERDMDKEEE